jgi:DNA-binding winged helix-turn-helix (wHTH) protein
LVRFGVFEVDLQEGELRKQGLKIKLQGQPFRVLTMLLERSGQVVTRDELQKQLWNEDTFVDFDQGLNKAINRLREALNDSAENPRFIETLPKRGYRFIAPIEQVPNAPGADPGSNPANDATAQPQPQSQQTASRSGREKLALALAALFLATSVSLAVIHFARAPEPAQQSMRSSILPPPDTALLPYSFHQNRSGCGCNDEPPLR